MATTSELFASLDEPAKRRFLATLKPAQLNALYHAIVNEEPSDPKQRLLWHCRREQAQRFDAWCRKLNAVELSKVYLEIVAGQDPEQIMAGAH